MKKTRASSSTAGIALMLAGTALFSINDALGKWLLATYSVGELLLVRSVTALILLVPFVYQVGTAAFTGAHAGRCSCCASCFPRSKWRCSSGRSPTCRSPTP
jgi:hypothetical protein